MSTVIVTGSGGLIGSAAVSRFAHRGFHVVGIDNDLRSSFFGPAASTAANSARLSVELGDSYSHRDIDVRDYRTLVEIFAECSGEVAAVVHAAGQPSHDWAARDPQTDFSVNAVGTLNVLECVRQMAPDASFIFMSTNKVYGDRPNLLPVVETESRFELPDSHPFYNGITEDMRVDQCLHSVFGVSKLSADVMTQEYGRYFGLATVCLRGGTLTGPGHAAAELHGFLAYLVRCARTGTPYTIYGYGGKQVRDAIHADDVAEIICRIAEAPIGGRVYNVGGGRVCNISVLEAIELVEDITGEEMNIRHDPTARIGDHIWWVGSNERLMADYPGWRPSYSPRSLIEEIAAGQPAVTRYAHSQA